MNDDDYDFIAALTAQEYAEYRVEQLAIAKAVDKALAEYKQALITFIDDELRNIFDPYTERYDEDQGRFNAFVDMKEFITNGQ